MWDKVKIGWPHVGRCRSTSKVRVEDTDDIAFQVHMT